MAITATAVPGKMQLVLEKTNDEGKLVQRSKTFSGIENAASDEDVHAVASALGAMQKNTVNSIMRVDIKALEETV